MSSNTLNQFSRLNVRNIPSTKHNTVCFVWAHGWMRSHQDFLPIAQQLTDLGDHYLLDLPGHGDSPLTKPAADMSIEDYLDPILQWIQQIQQPIIWIGHSFGCRIGAHIAHLCPQKIQNLKLICPPFNQKKSFSFKQLKVLTYKTLLAIGLSRHILLPLFASKDYLNCQELRPLFSKWVSEDSHQSLAKTTAPLELIFAAEDTETPPSLAPLFKKARPDVQMHIWQYFDHNTILTDGQHQVIQHFLKSIQPEIT